MRGLIDEWAEVFAGSDACVTPVLSPWEAHEHPHNASREAFVEVSCLAQPAPAPRSSRIATANPRPADEGVTKTLGDWGIAADHAERLLADGAIG